MKKLLIVFSILLSAVTMAAQTTAVTATITDSDGQLWNNGSYTITFVPTPNKPGPYTCNGNNFNQGPFTGALSNAGVLTVTLTDNSCVAPAGSAWLFVVCPNATSTCGQLTLPVTGGSMNLSSQLSAIVPVVRFPTSLGSNFVVAYGYADAEVTPTPKNGGQYFNVTSKCQRIWDGTAWGCSTGSIIDLSSPPPIGNVTPNTGAFTTLGAGGTGYFNINGTSQAQFNLVLGGSRTVFTDNTFQTRGIDIYGFAQTVLVPPGQTIANTCPGPGQLVNAPQFVFGAQFDAINCDVNSTFASTAAILGLGANITLRNTNSRQTVSGLEMDTLSYMPYSIQWDNYGQIPGSEFYNWGALFTNVGVGIGGTGVFVKSNFYNQNGPLFVTWVSGGTHQAGDVVIPTAPNNFYYQITTPYALPTACASSSTQPTWPTTAGVTVVDGTCTWTTYAYSGQGAWEVAYRGQDWIAAGFDVFNNNPYSNDFDIMLRSPDSTHSNNIGFANGNPGIAGNVKYVMGLNHGAFAGYFNLFNVAANVQAFTIKPSGEIDFNTNSVGMIELGNFSSSGVVSATGGFTSGAGYDSSTGYKAGGTQFVNSAGQVDAAKLAATTGVVPQAALGNGIPNVGTPTAGQAACIKSAGPPVVIGYCSSVVGAGGACTCN